MAKGKKTIASWTAEDGAKWVVEDVRKTGQFYDPWNSLVIMIKREGKVVGSVPPMHTPVDRTTWEAKWQASQPKRAKARKRTSGRPVAARIRLTDAGYEVEGPMGATRALPSKRALVVEVDRLLRAKPNLIVIGDQGSLGPNTPAVRGSAPEYAIKNLQGSNVAEGDDPRALWGRKFGLVIGAAPMGNPGPLAIGDRVKRSRNSIFAHHLMHKEGAESDGATRKRMRTHRGTVKRIVQLADQTRYIVEWDDPKAEPRIIREDGLGPNTYNAWALERVGRAKATGAKRPAKPKSAPRRKPSRRPPPKRAKNGQYRELIREYKLDIVGNDVRQAAQIAEKVRKGIQEAADICKISPPVCVGNLGLSRSKMPQIEGDLSVIELLAGDRANPPKGEAIVAAGGSPTDERTTLDQFLDSLEAKGVKTRRRRVPVGNLKATQREIKAAKVYGMADAHLRGNFPNLDKQIVISNDGHILDGHHRWAALLTIDPKRRMSVLEVDLPMGELLNEAAATPGVYRANFAGTPLGAAAQRKYKQTHRSKLRGGSKSKPRRSSSAAWKEILG